MVVLKPHLYIVLFLRSLFSEGSQAQVELVLNGSFESYVSCPSSQGIINTGNARNWSAPTYGSSDHFHKCATDPNFTLPSNIFGNENTHTGQAYAGIGTYTGYAQGGGARGYTEYIQATLRTPLEAGKTYRVELFVSLSDISSDGSPLGVYLLNEEMHLDIDTSLKPPPGLYINFSQVVTRSSGWTRLVCFYQAKGGETNLIIGNFVNTKARLIPSSQTQWGTYYYIDDVSLIPCTKVHSPDLLGNDTTVCIEHTYPLKTNDPAQASTKYLWSTNDTTPTTYISASGRYWINTETINPLDSSCSFSSDSINITFKKYPHVNLGNDTGFCGTSPGIVLDAGYTDSASYSWSTGDSLRFLTALAEGTYTVSVSNLGCTASDSVFVRVSNIPVVDLGKDTIMCEGNTLLLNTYLPMASYTWQDGSRLPSYLVSKEGMYTVTVAQELCSVTDSIMVQYTDKPQFRLGPDTGYCFTEPVLLQATNKGGDTYLWQDHSTNASFTAQQSGSYWVEVTRSVCVFTDSIILSQYPFPDFSLGEDTFFCEGGSYLIDPGEHFSSYLWNTGSKQKNILAVQPGKYILTVWNNYGCPGLDSIFVDRKPAPVFTLGEDIRTCNPDFVLSPGPFISYLWQDGSTSPDFHVTDYGIHYVTITDNYGCENSSQVNVINSCPPIVFVPNAFTPNGDGINDLFIPSTLNIEAFNMEIYDSWGQLLFKTDNPEEGWNGRNNYQDVSSGVYVFKITYTDVLQHEGISTGNVTLLR